MFNNPLRIHENEKESHLDPNPDEVSNETLYRTRNPKPRACRKMLESVAGDVQVAKVG